MIDKVNVGKAKLEEAFLQYEQTYYESFSEDTGSYEHSPDFEERMRTLLFKPRQNAGNVIGNQKRESNHSSLGKRAVFFLLAAALMLTGIMGVSAIAEPTDSFFLKSHGYFWELVSDDETISQAPKKIETVYKPTVPSDFTPVGEYLSEYEVKLIWMNENQKRIAFTQLLLDTKSTMDSENVDLRIRYIGSLRIACSDKNGLKTFYWNTSEYSFSLVVPSTIPDAVCMDIICSVAPQRND